MPIRAGLLKYGEIAQRHATEAQGQERAEELGCVVQKLRKAVRRQIPGIDVERAHDPYGYSEELYQAAFQPLALDDTHERWFWGRGTGLPMQRYATSLVYTGIYWTIHKQIISPTCLDTRSSNFPK